MGQPIPAQHPSVVLRSHFNLVRTLLIIAMAAVCALTAAVVILANDEDQISGGATSAKPIESINYGGPEEGTRGATSVQPQTAPGARYDGGPEEGSRGPQQSEFKARSGGPRMVPQGPLSR